MISVTFILQDKSQRDLEIESGLSLMDVAVRNNVPGIAADCGGACSCGTCLIHVSPGCMSMVGCAGEYEAALLDFSEYPSPFARLACQITTNDSMDGLVVEIP